MNRRLFMQSLGLWAGSAGSSLTYARCVGRRASSHPFGWADAAARTAVERLAIAERETSIALQVTRPLGAGGEFLGPGWGSLFDPRADLLMLNARMTDAEPLARISGGSCSPLFSPDGQRLSALTAVAPGRVGLVVWSVERRSHRVFSDMNVELFLCKFRDWRSAYGGPSLGLPIPRQYLWLNERALLFVDRGMGPQTGVLANANLSPRLDELRQRTEGGGRAVRVWSDHSPTCGVGGRVIKMCCDTGVMTTLFEGDVRGVSVSPDGRRLAMLVATGNVSPAPDKAMASEFMITSPFDDPMVTMKLTLVELSSTSTARDIGGVMAVGNVAPSRLPYWNADSTRVTVPVRTTYSDAAESGSDLVWEVSAATGEARHIVAASALEAELLAAVLSSDIQGPQSLIRALRERTGGELGSGGVWRCGPSQIMLWRSGKIAIVSPSRIVELAGEFAAVNPPVVGNAVARTVAVRRTGESVLISTGNDAHEIENVTVEPEWQILGVLPDRGQLMYKSDGQSGTDLILAQPGVRSRKSPVSFNGYFRKVTQPQRRMLTHEFPGGEARRGVLQLPIGHREGRRHPVVVWAYPNAVPSMSDSLARANSAINCIIPAQYLLAKGFAFFEAPFPITGAASSDPMRSAVSAILPWLDVLDDQPELVAGNYGFFGFSNAGYAALALEALSSRFKAIVAWNTFPELGYAALHSYSADVALSCAGNLIQANRMYYEGINQPYRPRPAPPWKDAYRYIRNDPVFNLSRASTPLLLLEGESDGEAREVEEVYSILYGSGVPVELAYYWGEGHVFASPGNIHDCWRRVERFFREYLSAS